MAIDLRQAFINTLKEYGYPIIYVRRDKRFRCSCYIEHSGDTRSDCPKCFGTGYKVSVEKMLTRRMLNASYSNESLLKIRNNASAGIEVPTGYVYYLAYNENPKDGDLILEVEWNGNLPVKIKNKFVISLAEPEYGQGGLVAFYQVYCRYQPKGLNDDDALT